MKTRLFSFLLIIFVALVLAIITSCDSKPKRVGVDGYYFEQETFIRTDFSIEIVLVKSDAEMAELIRTKKNIQGEVDPKNVAAFSVLRKNDMMCTIYMIDPKVRYEPQWYGHELTHCIYGIWHQEPQAGR